MANETYKLISSVTVGAAGTNLVQFTNIPQTFTDLKIVVSARGSQTFSNQGNFYFVRPNGLTTNQTSKYFLGIGTSVATGNYVPFAYMPASDNTAQIFSNNEHYISNYTTSLNKTIMTDTVNENNQATVYGNAFDAGLWQSSSAITSLDLTTNAGNFVQYSTFYLYGISNSFGTNVGPKATGGTVTSYTSGGTTYYAHTFTSDGTFTPLSNLSVQYLVIAGGGAGGYGYINTTGGGGGGGAGGYRCSVTGESSGGGASAESAINVTANTNYSITIGGGGSAVGGDRGNPGGNSIFSTITSTGGGGGGNQSRAGGSGGSSGGGGFGGVSSPGGTAGQGFGGGFGNGGPGTGGGGGGGAGGAGQTVGGNPGGTGGAGVTSSITGTAVARGGGAGGGGNSNSSASAGGGIGNGLNGTAGTANTGGGGGGAWGDRVGSNGGSGIVVVRYAV